MFHLKPLVMAGGGKDAPAPIGEAEIDVIRKRLSRRLREPDDVSTTNAPAKQQDCKKLDLLTLRRKLSMKLKKRSS